MTKLCPVIFNTHSRQKGYNFLASLIHFSANTFGEFMAGWANIIVGFRYLIILSLNNSDQDVWIPAFAGMTFGCKRPSFRFLQTALSALLLAPILQPITAIL